MQRYFARDIDSNKFILNDSDIHHIKTVMRMKNNDLIEVVFNNELYLAKVNIDNKITITKEKQLNSKETSKIKTSLIIPLLKENKTDLILQKSTELGVNYIYIVPMERTVVKIDKKVDSKIDRWIKICKEASEQSKRLDIPEVKYLDSLKSVIDIEGLNLVCSTQNNVNSVKSLLQSHHNCDRINVVIGPEGGLSEKEEKYLVENGFNRISLGENILRVETVPLSILSIINYEFME